MQFRSDRDVNCGDTEEFVVGSVAVVKSKDNKSVLMTSNCTGADSKDCIQRWNKKRKSYVRVSAPKVISNYNKHMGGVDILDQMVEYY